LVRVVVGVWMFIVIQPSARTMQREHGWRSSTELVLRHHLSLYAPWVAPWVSIDMPAALLADYVTIIKVNIAL